MIQPHPCDSSKHPAMILLKIILLKSMPQMLAAPNEHTKASQVPNKENVVSSLKTVGLRKPG